MLLLLAFPISIIRSQSFAVPRLTFEKMVRPEVKFVNPVAPTVTKSSPEKVMVLLEAL